MGFNTNSLDSHPFGFQCTRQGNQLYGDGNLYETHFRNYDPRLGRWLSLDPIQHPWQGSYTAFNNNPILFEDPFGLAGKKNNGGDGNEEGGDVAWKNELRPVNIEGERPVSDLLWYFMLNTLDDNDDYMSQDQTMKGSYSGAGPLIYSWSKARAKPDPGSGYWQDGHNVASELMGSWGFGDVYGYRTQLKVNQNIQEELQTNSLVKILNYGSARVKAYSAGYGFTDIVHVVGKAEDGTVVWKMTGIIGYNIGVSPPQVSKDVRWSLEGIMSFEDSAGSAGTNYINNKGDTAEYGKWLRKRGEFKKQVK